MTEDAKSVPGETPGHLPIYIEIQRDLERQIATGELRPGDRIPTETELVETYNCSRMTVNRAISNLANSGIVIRKRRSGTFVAMPRVTEPLLSITDIKTEVLTIDRAYDFKIESSTVSRVSEAFDVARLGLAIGTPIRTIELVHFADNLPFVMETHVINLDAVPAAEHMDFSRIPPGSWLLENVPWTEGEHSIRAISADLLTSRKLRVSPDSACVSIARRVWRDERLISFVRLVYPGERHRFLARFRPGSPA